MYPQLFWSLFALNVVLAIYLSVKPLTHAQPWRMFALGFGTLTLTFWIQISFDDFAKFFQTQDVEQIRSSFGLISLSVSAMAGALFSTAITNRAQSVHKNAVDSLQGRIKNAKASYLTLADEIHAKLSDHSQKFDREEFLGLEKLRRRLMADYILEVDELTSELRKLGL